VQDSPIKKSVPQETILFGDFAGRLDSQLSSSQTQEVQNSKFKSQEPVKVNTVFGRLKGHFGGPNQQLRKNEALEATGIPRSFNFQHFSSIRCFKCLAWGHPVRECKGSVRCWGCFGYGHKQRQCFNLKGSGSSKWIPKKQRDPPMNTNATIDTVAEGIMENREVIDGKAAAGWDPQGDGTIAGPVPHDGEMATGSLNRGNVDDGLTSHALLLQGAKPSAPIQPSSSQLFDALHPSSSSLPVMANFAVNPTPFIPPAMFIEDGGPLRRARKEVYIWGVSPKVINTAPLQ
jgi:hypothetical protein